MNAREKFSPPEKGPAEQLVPMPGALANHLAFVPDPRVARTRKHSLVDILTIAVCATICGYRSYYDMADFAQEYRPWLGKWLALANGTPSHDTFRRVLGLVSPAHFQTAFRLWAESVRAVRDGDVLAIDGKALRRAAEAGGAVQYIVNAWSDRNRLVLGQTKVESKENEISALPRLLGVLDVRGCTVTIDAIGCQKDIAALIRKGGGHYMLALKGNHPVVEEEMRAYLEDAIRHGGGSVATHVGPWEKGHGRLERRTCHVGSDLRWFADRPLWKDLRCVVMVESERMVQGVASHEKRLYLCSADVTPEEALRIVRSHWGVENKVHWVLDMVFDEDRSRARDRNAAENLATIRRMALNAHRLCRPDESVRLKWSILRAARHDEYREKAMRYFLTNRAEKKP